MPLAAFILPKMGRPSLVAQVVKHFWTHVEVLHDLLEVKVRELSVKSLDEGYSLLAKKVFVPDLLRCVVGRPPDTELHKGRVVMKIVNLVVNAVVFGICPLGPNRTGLETGMLGRVVVGFLGDPLQVIAQVMDLYVRGFE